jgi:hypothetical protein
MAWRGHEAQAKALQIIEGVGERVDLKFASVARSGVNLANGEAASQAGAGGVIDLRRVGREFGVLGAGRFFRQRPFENALEQNLAHARAA